MDCGMGAKKKRYTYDKHGRKVTLRGAIQRVRAMVALRSNQSSLTPEEEHLARKKFNEHGPFICNVEHHEDIWHVKKFLKELGQQVTDPEVIEFFKMVDPKEERLYLDFDNLVKFLEKRKWAHLRVATDPQLDTLEAFVAMGGNPDKSGFVDTKVLMSSIIQFNLNLDVWDIIAAMDKDFSGKVDWSEFCSIFYDLQQKQQLLSQHDMMQDGSSDGGSRRPSNCPELIIADLGELYREIDLTTDIEEELWKPVNFDVSAITASAPESIAVVPRTLFPKNSQLPYHDALDRVTNVYPPDSQLGRLPTRLLSSKDTMYSTMGVYNASSSMLLDDPNIIRGKAHGRALQIPNGPSQAHMNPLTATLPPTKSTVSNLSTGAGSNSNSYVTAFGSAVRIGGDAARALPSLDLSTNAKLASMIAKRTQKQIDGAIGVLVDEGIVGGLASPHESEVQSLWQADTSEHAAEEVNDNTSEHSSVSGITSASTGYFAIHKIPPTPLMFDMSADSLPHHKRTRPLSPPQTAATTRYTPEGSPATSWDTLLSPTAVGKKRRHKESETEQKMLNDIMKKHQQRKQSNRQMMFTVDAMKREDNKIRKGAQPPPVEKKVMSGCTKIAKPRLPKSVNPPSKQHSTEQVAPLDLAIFRYKHSPERRRDNSHTIRNKTIEISVDERTQWNAQSTLKQHITKAGKLLSVARAFSTNLDKTKRDHKGKDYSRPTDQPNHSNAAVPNWNPKSQSGGKSSLIMAALRETAGTPYPYTQYESMSVEPTSPSSPQLQQKTSLSQLLRSSSIAAAEEARIEAELGGNHSDGGSPSTGGMTTPPPNYCMATERKSLLLTAISNASMFPMPDSPSHKAQPFNTQPQQAFNMQKDSPIYNVHEQKNKASGIWAKGKEQVKEEFNNDALDLMPPTVSRLNPKFATLLNQATQ